jgi:hypothetical protein
MTTFHEQMKKLRDDDEYGNIFPNDDWTLQDYKDIFWCINKGYLVQDCGTSFMINQEWEGDDIYAEEFLEEELEVNYIVYGEWLEYDDDGSLARTYNDEFTEFKSKEEALLEYNRLIKNNGDKEYDLIYLDYIEGEGTDEREQDNIEFWEKGEPKEEEKPKKKIKFRVMNE